MIGIIDYGMGNLGSVTNAFAFLGTPARIITRPEEIEEVAAVILPGVGAFGDCMQHLRDHGFEQPICEWIRSGKPFLGICLGLHVLFEGSEESPDVPGLGLLKGRVRLFAGNGLKVPQIGWNTVTQENPDCPLFLDEPDGSHFYFVHSYYVECDEQTAIAGVTDYGATYTSVVWRDNVMAVQFHPEKSQARGLQLLKNFVNWAEGVTKT